MITPPQAEPNDAGEPQEPSEAEDVSQAARAEHAPSSTAQWSAQSLNNLLRAFLPALAVIPGVVALGVALLYTVGASLLIAQLLPNDVAIAELLALTPLEQSSPAVSAPSSSEASSSLSCSSGSSYQFELSADGMSVVVKSSRRPRMPRRSYVTSRIGSSAISRTTITPPRDFEPSSLKHASTNALAQQNSRGHGGFCCFRRLRPSRSSPLHHSTYS
jgi:hypothetical protein